MTKLKNLEDIRLERRKIGVGDGETFEIIKKEAIKHIKECEDKDCKVFTCKKCNWIKKFFNPTTEDLK